MSAWRFVLADYPGGKVQLVDDSRTTVVRLGNAARGFHDAVWGPCGSHSVNSRLIINPQAS